MSGHGDDLDIGLTLGNPYSCNGTRSNNKSGAGVNAGPSVDMTFAASDPLSELVWSPHKGLSLKCADCSNADKKPFLFWNVGPSNIIPSPPSQSIGFQEETSEEKIVDGNLILSNAKLECTAENDFLDQTTKEAACGKSEGRLPRGGSLSPGNSPINSNQKRGKCRALSDDSNESVESCNRTRLHSKGKRRLEYEENFVFESKRLRQSGESPVSVSAIRNGSSFMTWICNMVKGFTKSNEEEDHLLHRDLSHSNPKYASSLQETMICSDRQDSLSRNMGFKTMFQSLYSQNTKVIEAGVSRDDYSLELSQGLIRADKANAENSLTSCPGQNGAPCENFMSNDKTIRSMTDEGIRSGCQNMLFTTIPVVESETEFAENKTSAIPLCNGDGDKNENPDLASEVRPVNDVSNKSNLFGSLWITRFTPKTGSTTPNLDQSKRISSCEAIEYPDHKAVSSQNQKN